MDLINEEKLQAVGEKLIDRLQKAVSLELVELLSALDGWTITITLKRPSPKP